MFYLKEILLNITFCFCCVIWCVFIKQMWLMDRYCAVLFLGNGLSYFYMKGMLKCLTKRIFHVPDTYFSAVVCSITLMCMLCGVCMLLFHRLFSPVCSFIRFLLSVVICVFGIPEICFAQCFLMAFFACENCLGILSAGFIVFCMLHDVYVFDVKRHVRCDARWGVVWQETK